MAYNFVLSATGDVNQDTQNLINAVNQHVHVSLDSDNYVPFRIDQTIELRFNGQKVQGVNPWATVIEWCGDPAQACVFKIIQAQYVTVSDLMIRPGYWGTPQMVECTGGSAIHVTGAPLVSGWLGSAFACVDNVWIKDMWTGIHVEGGAEHRLNRIQLRALRGPDGILFKATEKAHSMYRCIVNDVVADWGDYENKLIKWINFNSYSYSLRIDAAALMNGGYGIYMGDDVASDDSYPMWILANDVECDHNQLGGVYLCAGEGFQCGESWWGSSITGSGLVTCDAWRGDLAVTNTRIYGNAKHGIRLDVGKVSQISTVLVGDNSAWSPGVHAGIWVGSKCEDVRISGYSGDCVGVTGNNQSYGVVIEAGAQNVDVSDLNVFGNKLGGVADDTSPHTHKKLPQWDINKEGWLSRLWRWIIPG